MRILFVGDIVGSPGRRAVQELLPRLVDRHLVDLVVANAENAAGGIGITPQVAEELLNLGVDVLTTGNHVWKHKEIVPYLEENDRVLRPANYPPGTPGRGWTVVETAAGQRAAILNLEGRVFMSPLECPFRTADRLLAELPGDLTAIIVDFHAEATSEKQALGWYLDGRVSALIGTHTHVQTADERILPGGTGYLTDVGMTGPTHGVIGMKKEIILERFLSQRPQPFKVATAGLQLQGVLVDLTDDGHCRSLTRLQETVKG